MARKQSVPSTPFYLLDVHPGYQSVSLWLHTPEKGSDKGPNKGILRQSSLPLNITPFKPDAVWVNELSDFLFHQIQQTHLPIYITIPSIYSQCITLPLGFSAPQIQTALLSEVEQLYLFQQTTPNICWHLVSQTSDHGRYYFSAQPTPLIDGLKEAVSTNEFCLKAIMGSDTLLLHALLEQDETACVAMVITDQGVTLVQREPGISWSNVHQTPFPSQMDTPLDDIAPWVKRHVDPLLAKNDAITGLVASRIDKILPANKLITELQQVMGKPVDVEVTITWRVFEQPPEFGICHTLAHFVIENKQPVQPLFYHYSDNPETHPVTASQSRIVQYRSFVRAALVFLNGLALFAFIGWWLFIALLQQQTISQIASSQQRIEQLTRESSLYRDAITLYQGLERNATMYNWVVYGASEWQTDTSPASAWPSPLQSIALTTHPQSMMVTATLTGTQCPNEATQKRIQLMMPHTTWLVTSSLPSDNGSYRCQGVAQTRYGRGETP